MTGHLPKLNFPVSQYRIRDEKGKLTIFDIVRMKYVPLTPEEWVRQNCIHFLNHFRGFPIGLMAVERSLELNGQKFRFDVMAYAKSGQPLLLVECKAPEVVLSQATVDQIVVYNMKLNVPVLLMTNGLKHIVCKIDSRQGKMVYLDDLPCFHEIETDNGI